MPALMIEYRDEAERLGLEQAIAFFTPMRHVAQTAPDGTVLAACEQVALRDGRALLRKSLASAVAAHIDAAEQKGGPPAPGPARRWRRPLPRETRASGRDRRGADRRGPPLFPLPGLWSRRLRGRPRVGPGRLPDRRRRLACLAGVQQSFARAEMLLTELGGWDRDDETIRRLCHREAARATATRDERATAEAFAAASGDREVPIDAGKVNTLEGGRDVKGAVFACRERGEATDAAGWDRRESPGAVGSLGDGGDRGGVGVRRAVQVLNYFAGHQGALELRVAVTAGPVDRQRQDRGFHQATRESAVEADGGALEGGTRRPFGGVVRWRTAPSGTPIGITDSKIQRDTHLTRPSWVCLWNEACRLPRTHEYVRPGLYCHRPPGFNVRFGGLSWSPLRATLSKARGERTRESGGRSGCLYREAHPPSFPGPAWEREGAPRLTASPDGLYGDV